MHFPRGGQGPRTPAKVERERQVPELRLISLSQKHGPWKGRSWEFDLTSVLRRVRIQDNRGIWSRGWESRSMSRVG